MSYEEQLLNIGPEKLSLVEIKIKDVMDLMQEIFDDIYTDLYGFIEIGKVKDIMLQHVIETFKEFSGKQKNKRCLKKYSFINNLK